MGVCSPARDESSNYVAYGSSMIVNPWGTILTKASCYEDFIISEINLDYLKKLGMNYLY